MKKKWFLKINKQTNGGFMNANYDLSWAGRLTKENIKEVVRLMSELLEGKNYAMVMANQKNNFIPKLKLNCYLINGVIEIFNDKNAAGFNFSDNFGNYGFRTELEEDTSPTGFETPYFNFKEGGLTISYNSSCVGLTHFGIKVQGDLTQRTIKNEEIVPDFIC